MVKQFLIYLAVVYLVTSCNYGGPKKPKNLISEKDMVNILIDARLIGGASFSYKQKLQDKGVKLDSYVFEKYGIDSLQFALSNAYYAYNIKEYETIYNKVNDSLETLKKSLQVALKKEERALKRRKKDSIDALKLKDSLKAKKIDSLKLKALKVKKPSISSETNQIKTASDKARQSQK